MRITAIRPQVRNPERVSIFLDGKYSFSLSLDELLREKLKNGDEIDQAAEKKFKKISADGKLRARTLEWLLNRPRSTRELRDYLYRKKAEPEIINSLVEEFSAKSYLDDAKFAVWLVELQKRRGKSDLAIKSELFKKGLSGELVDEIMRGGENDEVARLKAVIAKKQKLTRYKNDPQKLTKYLTSQGFSWNLIKECLAKNDPEE
ncbi:RecX family transcriptional regulator [Candidatus Saccharibacteria bacterium]|nr:RecX family transcriptional regulator [Candidatus Saccharibacteria bacterium]